MNWRFAARLAWREGRGAVRKTGIHALAVAMGVGALVAVHGFRADADRSIKQEARTLMGADVRFSRRDALPDSVQRVADSLVAGGARLSTVVTVPSMVLAERTSAARLFQVRSVQGGWPFYGEPTSEPPDEWPPGDRRGAWVDPAVLVQLDARIGDTLLIGDLRLPILATVTGFPTDFGFQTAVGPQVLLSGGALEDAGLLGFGSLVRYEIYLATPDEGAPEELWERYQPLFRSSGTGYSTARRQAENLSGGLDALSRYLGVVGLAALLLGGIGVASAVHVFVRSKLTSVAVLRCLGASRRLVLFAYVLQAGAVGVLGSLLGAAGGVALQMVLPSLLGDLLPVGVEPRVSWSAVSLGMLIGIWTTVTFALGPLLPIRRVPPLRALRADFESNDSSPDGLVRGTRVLLVGTGVILAIIEAPSVLQGLAIAGGLGVVLLSLWLLALASTWLVRRFFPARLPYAARQGVSNLFRPRNQTVSVVMAVGFGVFVVTTVVEVERNLADGLSLDGGANMPNVLLFDIQSDQRSAVEALVSEFAQDEPTSSPLVPSRIAAIDGRPAADLLADTAEGGPQRWALRREYRNTYRPDLSSGDELVRGAWWNEAPPSDVTRISVEEDLGESLGLTLGSRVTWTLGGREIETEVSSFRAIDWARFEPNSYVVFEPGVLEEAPHTWLTLARVATAEDRARMQRDVALRFRNVSVLDLARVQQALDRLLGVLRRVMTLLAVFSALAGIIILGGAVAVSRSQRMREAALLKTLGARRGQVLGVLATEYTALAGLAAAGALVLALAASWVLVSQAFEMPFRAHLAPVLSVVAVVTTVSLAAGLIGSRGILSRPPLRVLRDLGE